MFTKYVTFFFYFIRFPEFKSVRQCLDEICENREKYIEQNMQYNLNITENLSEFHPGRSTTDCL